MIMYTDTWLQKYWRPLCAVAYLLIVLCDFVFMPIWVHMTASTHQENNITRVKELSDSSAQIEALRILYGNSEWKPISLDGSGLVHIAFLTILGVASWTRGQEKITRLTTPPPSADKTE